MTHHPTVMGVIAAKNAAPTIGRAVRSLLEQEGSFELTVTVVDDASTDGTADAAQAVESPRVTVIRSDEPIGRAAARNLAAKSRAADFLAIQDADDYSLPGRMARTLALMERPDTVLVSGQAVFYSERLGAWRLHRYPTDQADISERLRLGRMPVSHTASLIRAAAFHEVGGYDSSFVRAQDLDLVLRLSRIGGIQVDRADLVRYTHPVVLPYEYWQENRRYSTLVAAANGIVATSSRTPQHAHYVAAMARRCLVFLRSRHAARRALDDVLGSL